MKTPRHRGLSAAGALALITVAAAPGVALALDVNSSPAAVAAFDARATASPGSYCVDIPEVLIGQKICGGMIQSDITATSDPRGYAQAGLALVPKLFSIPLLIPERIPTLGTPIPPEVTKALKQIKVDSLPSQCQAQYPALNIGDDNRTCGGPTTPGGDAFGATFAGANAQVQSGGDPEVATSTRTIADARVSDLAVPGLQAGAKNAISHAEGGINKDGVPVADADVRSSGFSALGGVFSVDGIRSRATVAFDGTKAGTAASTSFSFGSATFAGIPVDITPKGLTVATSVVPVEQIKLLSDQLAGLINGLGQGAVIKLIPAPAIQVNESQVIATSAAISIDFVKSFPGVNANATINMLVGQTTAKVGAQPADSGSGGDGDVGSSGSGGSAGSAGSGGDLGPGSGSDGSGTISSPPLSGGDTSGVLTGNSSGGELPELAGPAGGADDVISDTETGIGDQEALDVGFTRLSLLSPDRLKNIYPIFVVLVLGSFVLSRGRRLTEWPFVDDNRGGA